MITRNECKAIRQEIDHASPVGARSKLVTDHVRHCDECSTFESEHRTLLNLVGSLGTVAAPPDFDFRLRARLAREKSTSGNGGGFLSLLKPARLMAVASLVLLIGVGVVVVKNRRATENQPSNTVASKEAAPVPAASVATVDNHEKALGTKLANVGGETPTPGPTSRNTQRTTIAAFRRTSGSATREFGLSPASVSEKQLVNSSPIVRVPIEDEPLTISIEDPRGTARTVSLPTVSFGSQRLMTGQSFQPTTSPVRGSW
jgi:hypothetical protein